ncbi:hypothetical protein [Phormidium nigroviride]|uniref:hypothetical protein n=1 Tax=Phormidium nigroviride TaxID=482564 RepID=UPI0003051AED|nr:hypothetical protein [Oscillatoria nigro-viridis]
MGCWKLDKTWLGDIKIPLFFGFAQDTELVKTGWYSVKDSDYDALYLKDKDWGGDDPPQTHS